MNDAIFISYRRDDSEGEAGRLHDDLARVFGPQAVFMDVSDIHPGKDFRKAIDDNVAHCSVFLAVIGPAWATMKDASGARRIDQPNDFVRLEISSALARGIDVIPVLVHGARMPNLDELPDSIKDLSYRNAVELTHTRWNSDVEVLIRTLREYVQQGGDVPTMQIRSVIEGIPLATKVPARQSAQPEPPPPQPGFARNGIAILIVVLAVVAGAGGYVLIHHMFKHHKKDEAPVSKPAPHHAQAALAYDFFAASAAASFSGSTRILLILRPSNSTTVNRRSW